MRNFAIVVGALLVLTVGFVFATRSDEADAPTAADAVTTTETVTAEAGAPPEAAPEEPAPVAEPEPEPDPVPTIAYSGGKPKGGVRKLDFKKGERVRFKVTSDVPEEIHVHGFDLYRDVGPGKSVTFAFEARFDGEYEVEMHDSAQQIASLVIRP